MNYSKAVQMVQSGYKLPNEGASGRFREPLFLEVAPDMREKLSPFGYFCHQAVQTVGLHGLVETNDIGVPQSPHELRFSKQVLFHIVFLNFVSFDYFDRNLEKNKGLILNKQRR